MGLAFFWRPRFTQRLYEIAGCWEGCFDWIVDGNFGHGFACRSRYDERRAGTEGASLQIAGHERARDQRSSRYRARGTRQGVG